MNVLVLVGSLRADSLNRRLADVALSHLPTGAHAVVWPGLAELPHYNEELDGESVPAAAAELRAAVRDADALLVVTPEFNGSLPGALKNAIDWMSRPRGASALAGLPAGVLAASPSPRGAQWAREDAVRILRVAGAAALDDTVGVGDAYAAFADTGLVDAELDAAIASLVTRLTGQAAAAA